MEFDKCFEIRARLINKGLIICFVIVIVVSLLSLQVDRSFIAGGITLCVCIMIMTFVLLCFKSSIQVINNRLIYKGFLSRKEMNIKEIEKIEFAMNESGKYNRYFMIICADVNIVIKDIQMYKSDSFRLFLDYLFEKNNAIEKETINDIVRKIKWN
jgi:hypothetical protein